MAAIAANWEMCYTYGRANQKYERGTSFMKKRVLAFITALTVLLSLIGVPVLADGETVTIKLHYNRPDGNYTGWSVWFWDFGKDGVDIPFAEENGDMVATYQVGNGVEKVGFIVKLPDWAAKDVGEDQFIELGSAVSGTIHVYVESGVKGYEITYGDDVVTGIKVTKAEYNGDLAVTVTVSDRLLSDPRTAFELIQNGNKVTIASVTDNNSKNYTLNLSQPLDLLSSCTLIYDSKEHEVIMPDIFSTEKFEAEYTYSGSDLGAVWSKEKTAFRVWAPTASAVKVNLYESGSATAKDLIESIEMAPDVNGTWIVEKEGDLNGVYYTYSVTLGNRTNEAADPYARAAGVNGKRSMVIDLASTNPEGWEEDSDPNAGLKVTDAVIYELHVRDLSIDESSGITNKGKYLGLIETGTRNSAGIPTGLDHMKDLGITHLHILPMYDYGSVDETRLDSAQFNWGYDPVNYNVPEGSYSSDPYDGAVRISEVKQMVKGLHDNGISVVMDVVYNHVYSAGDFCFNKIVPNYFSRTNRDGSYSNGSGCGNDTASERSMVKKYIVDSVKYWADEYHIDGFRFDLVGLIDTETINEIMAEVHETHPNVIFYGEGWTMNTGVTKFGYTMTTQSNSKHVPGFAFFSDTIRDLLKGSVFNTNETGYVSGASKSKTDLTNSFMGLPSWAQNPTQVVNYVSCHDNNTLIDRITISTPNATRENQVRMNNLAAAYILTSQGIPFFQAGEEMLRTKPLKSGGYDHNSYSSPDSVNSIKWDALNEEEVADTYAYYKGLIAFRKAHPALRLTTAEQVKSTVTAVNHSNSRVLCYQLSGAEGETAESIFVIFNADTVAAEVALPEGNWNVYVNGESAGTRVLACAEGSVSVEGISAMVLIREDAPENLPTAPAATEDNADPGSQSNSNLPLIVGAAAGAAAIAAAAAAVVSYLKKKKK